LGAIDFKKGCYVGQENTSRIKLRNKLRRRILPIHVTSGKIYENDIIKYKDNEIGKVMIDKPFPFALVKLVQPDLKDFIDIEIKCGKAIIKIIKPKWI
jgi:folate-binding Fe-S cluster repair protein YgfZ